MIEPFSLPQARREAVMLPALIDLTERHRARSPEYANILRAIGHDAGRTYESVAELPWLPVGLFKHITLKSIADQEVVRVLTSSGTTGDVSRIYLDRAAAAAQTRALAGTLKVIFGQSRLPMLIVDSKAQVTSRDSLSARGAGVLGLMNFGRDHTFMLAADGRPDMEAVRTFLDRHGGEPFIIFGFTFMVWEYLIRTARDERLDLTNGILVHSGGWKKLVDRAVDNVVFRETCKSTGLDKVHNFYGMVEQIGVIYLEGPEGGSLYCPDVADVIVRDPDTWASLPPGQPGLIQVISTLPESYPGHVLLTEDLGVIHGIDDGHWPGKRFSILGRLPRAEARGCSDTFTVTEPVGDLQG